MFVLYGFLSHHAFLNPYAAGDYNLANTKWCKKPEKMTVTLTNGYSSESPQRELLNEYQHDRVTMVFEYIFAFDESSLSIGKVKSLIVKVLAL